MVEKVKLSAKVGFDVEDGFSLGKVRMSPSDVIFFRENLAGHRCDVTMTLCDPELLPCAHCNEEAVVWRSGEIHCETCHSTAPDADTWNRRRWTRGEADGL